MWDVGIQEFGRAMADNYDKNGKSYKIVKNAI